jgi:hypothetical protein
VSKFLGTFNAPTVAALPGSGTAGQIVALASTGQLYGWINSQWTALSGGGGGGNVGSAIVDFGSGGSDASIAVAAPTIQAGSIVLVSVAAKASTDHSADEHLTEELEVRAGNVVAGIGFTIYARTRNLALRGKWNVNWSWT